MAVGLRRAGQVLAIAHNGNLSNGMMFPWVENPATKKPLTREYAETRIKWEPLYEATASSSPRSVGRPWC